MLERWELMANSILDIKDILNEYSMDIQEGIEKDAQDIAKQAVNDLKATKNTYTIRTGKYNKGWRVNTKKGRGFINCTVHNATNWQLTHLLERGHDWVGRDGRRKPKAAKSYEHIKPVEQKYVKQYERDVERIIKNGG